MEGTHWNMTHLGRVDELGLELPYDVDAMARRLVSLPHLRLSSIYVHLCPSHTGEKRAWG